MYFGFFLIQISNKLFTDNKKCEKTQKNNLSNHIEFLINV